MLNIFYISFLVSVLALTCPETLAQLPDYVKNLAELNDNQYLNEALDNILIPRVVGSPGHEKVANYILSELNKFGLETEIDQFDAYTPIFGNLTFKNIIGKYNPNADEFIAVACHYDSKYFPEIPNFVGAIDSAVPATILLSLAKILVPVLRNIEPLKSNIGIMFIFFDGEEAFLEWSQQDSLYGARNLAKKMSSNKSLLRGSDKVIKDIDRIEVLVLLDLIGADNSKFKNSYFNTESLHDGLVKIERALAKANLLEGKKLMFLPEYSNSLIDDDHRPFLEKDVPILHLITSPFPKQWHKASDNAKNLHWPSIRNFNKVFRVFVYEFITKHDEKVNFRVKQYGI